MFDIGFLEMLVLMVLALIVLGPERLPKVARTVGYYLGRARAMMNSVKEEMEREVALKELKEAADSTRKSFNQGLEGLDNDMRSIKQDVKASVEHAGDEPAEDDAPSSNDSGHGEYEPPSPPVRDDEKP